MLLRIISSSNLAFALMLAMAGFATAQQSNESDTTKPYSPETFKSGQDVRDWDDPDIVHPAPRNMQNTGSRSLDGQTSNPDIVPFEGEMKSSLEAGSREIVDEPGKTIFNPPILGSGSRSAASGGNVIGSIIQLSDGRLSFRLHPNIAENALSAGSRPGSDADLEKELDSTAPELIGGTYRTPLGYDSRDDQNFDDDFSPPEDGTGTYNQPLRSSSRDDNSSDDDFSPPEDGTGTYNEPLRSSSRDDKSSDDDFSPPEDGTGTYNQPLRSNSRDEAEGAELVDEPVQVGGAHRKPLGYGSRDDDDTGGAEPIDEPVMVGGGHRTARGDSPKLDSPKPDAQDSNAERPQDILSQGSRNSSLPYRLRYTTGKQGTYDGLRFIDISYYGPAKTHLWRDAFNRMVSHYRKEDITAKKGGDYDFFRISGLSNSRARILGFYNEKSGNSGFLVVHRIDSRKVHYLINGAQPKSNGKDPGRFERWKIGHGDSGGNLATGESGYYTLFAAIQIWKANETGNACAAFWIRSRYE